MPADTVSIIDNIYNYDFLKASERLKSIGTRDPLLAETLNLEREWWMAMDAKGDARFSEFLKTLNHFETIENTDISGLISLTYRMRYYACDNKSYLVPLLYFKIRKQINLVDIEKLKLANDGSYELFVLYKSFLALIKDSMFTDRFLPGSGRKEALIGNIENIVKNGPVPDRTLGRYFLMKYYLDVKKDKPKAVLYLSELHEQYPNNKIFIQLLTN
jgi:hypothetical protein